MLLRRQQSAFSLVELSIVLVILGLLTGGILAGQSLIRAAELRSVTASSSKFRSAVYTFKDKYFALPGDMKNAVRFWGAQTGSTADGVDAACAALTDTTPSTDTRTCNGNGNGKVAMFESGKTIAQRAERYEIFRFWQHLANAGLIEGNYTGVQGDQGTIDHVIGSNAPALKLPNSGASFFEHSGGSFTFAGEYGNTLFIGSAKRPNETTGGLFSAEEMWNIDSKLDDGKPGLGGVRLWRIASCATSSVITDVNADYLLSAGSALTCTLVMPNF